MALHPHDHIFRRETADLVKVDDALHRVPSAPAIPLRKQTIGGHPCDIESTDM